MIRWAQRQPWYLEKPMPFVMILAWPFLWLWGTVTEFQRREFPFLGKFADDQPDLAVDTLTLPVSYYQREHG